MPGSYGSLLAIPCARAFVLGAAAGSWLAGSVADGSGSNAAFLLALIADVTAMFVASARRSLLVAR
jgi:hypothetical protein